jgi:hypothetical protein
MASFTVSEFDNRRTKTCSRGSKSFVGKLVSTKQPKAKGFCCELCRCSTNNVLAVQYLDRPQLKQNLAVEVD